ncbi:hypothetical protein GCM10008090_12560 [Arenicella chitinivorans]|uniref:Probable oxaloacetate decarboxylase gamma chain n=1 Tax=Arenicella chitinivorans TaxID=1329800 RepID=A0A918RM77_9GAMM|nr:OadG family protein [Arenicella chitinivorans]GHA04645.1 hypothetical protein GCM10008090_12560 [Arenicella chitinivorans]
MQETLIDQGLNLMLYGMGTVFVFLTILVFATVLMSRIVTRFSDDDVDLPTPQSAAISLDTTIPENHRRAIEKAIALYRQR